MFEVWRDLNPSFEADLAWMSDEAFQNLANDMCSTMRANGWDYESYVVANRAAIDRLAAGSSGAMTSDEWRAVLFDVAFFNCMETVT
jgi:hypothetical protein